MVAISFALAEFATGGPILDLPTMEGASWAVMLNRPDSLSCSVDMNDPAVKALDIPSSTEPKKTVLIARTEQDNILAMGLISDREWNDTDKVLTLNASGLWQYFNSTRIAPPSARTAALVLPDGSVNPALDTTFTGISFGTMAKRLVAQRLSWPGMSGYPFILPADEAADRTKTYPFVDAKMTGAALSDLTQLENGPDIAFDGRRAEDGLGLEYVLRTGTEAKPLLGRKVGSWAVGGQSSPIQNLVVTDDASAMATAIWMTAGRTSSKVLSSRVLNDELRLRAGYPSTDLVDTSRSDVELQSTLDSYARENATYASRPYRSLSFEVRADASPGIGQFRPGDWQDLDIDEGHPYLVAGPISIRILGMSASETADFVKIDCVVEA
jgi:hypothetical protein